MQKYIAMLRTDEDDRFITEWALNETGVDVPVKFVADIKELNELVTNDGEPVILLLNDKGAAHKGHEQLKLFKSNPAYGHIPLVILGEMCTRDYVKECYRAGANSFIIKPSTVEGTRKKVRDFFNYWFEVAEL